MAIRKESKRAEDLKIKIVHGHKPAERSLEGPQKPFPFTITECISLSVYLIPGTRENNMWFVSLVKLRRNVTRQDNERVNGIVAKWVAKGNKIHKVMYTLGEYDQVWLWESENENTCKHPFLDVADFVASQTMPAIDREEVTRWMI